MRKVLMIDNFDSFTYNLVQGLASLGSEVEVYRNNAITIDEAKGLAPDYLLYHQDLADQKMLAFLWT